MKRLLIIAILFTALSAFAQTPQNPQALSTDPQQIQNILEASGCKYEVATSAQTIASLQKRINELEKKLQAADPPPRSGATKK